MTTEDKGSEAQKKRTVKALVIQGAMTEEQIEKARDERGVPREHHWEQAVPGDKYVKPPFDMFGLALMPELNSELGQCIDALSANISGFGYQLVDTTSRVEGERTPEVEAEWEELDEFIKYGDWEGNSHTSVKKLITEDVETTGNGFLELVETAKGRIIGYNRVPSYTMRLGILDSEPTPYTQLRVIGRGKNRRVVERKRRKRFRRYVQLTVREHSPKVVWFKELGDPRPISADTGEILTQKQIEEGRPLANSMVHFRLPALRTPYGLPRYVGNILAIKGGRAAENVNFVTLRNNNIPSMIITVSGGALTEGTIGRIKEFSNSVIAGSDNRSRFLLIEADPDDQGPLGKAGQVKIDVVPLAQLQKDDAMFSQYEKSNIGKVRRAFRLPEVFVGESGDYTANNVDASRRIADEQVFAPERAENDWVWNKILLYVGARYHIYKSNGPNVTDHKHIIAVMGAAERSGAMTPRRATKMVEDIMGEALAPLGDGVELDTPFSVQMAEAVQNKADPKEVGQQVTALKSLDALRNRAVDIIVAKAKSLPGLELDADQAADLLNGVSDTVTVQGSFALPVAPVYILEGDMIVAIAKAVDVVEDGAATHIRLADALPLTPAPWSDIEPSEGAFHPSVKLG